MTGLGTGRATTLHGICENKEVVSMAVECLRDVWPSCIGQQPMGSVTLCIVVVLQVMAGTCKVKVKAPHVYQQSKIHRFCPSVSF